MEVELCECVDLSVVEVREEEVEELHVVVVCEKVRNGDDVWKKKKIALIRRQNRQESFLLKKMHEEEDPS